jgi:hypothetical protein
VYYYDERLVEGKLPAENGSNVPEEVLDAAVAEFAAYNCSCTKPFIYKTKSRSGFADSECWGFHTFLTDYNSACNGCVKAWSTSCC